ncbi:MAG: hypothetical protein ACRD0P_15250 [Stackebrandtia sp.]
MWNRLIEGFVPRDETGSRPHQVTTAGRVLFVYCLALAPLAMVLAFVPSEGLPPLGNGVGTVMVALAWSLVVFGMARGVLRGSNVLRTTWIVFVCGLVLYCLGAVTTLLWEPGKARLIDGVISLVLSAACVAAPVVATIKLLAVDSKDWFHKLKRQRMAALMADQAEDAAADRVLDEREDEAAHRGADEPPLVRGPNRRGISSLILGLVSACVFSTMAGNVGPADGTPGSVAPSEPTYSPDTIGPAILVFAVPAIVLGHLGLRDWADGEVTKRGSAIAGLIFGYGAAAMGVVWILASLR